jgi:signal transduction histidine kinase
VLAWSTCLLSVALIVGTLVVARVGDADMGSFGALFVVTIAAFALMGGLIAARRPENPIGWIFCGIGLSFSIASLATAWSEYAVVNDPGALPFGPSMAWLAVWMWSPGVVLLLTFLLLLFPEGRLPSRRWRPAAWLAGVALFATTLPVAVAAWPIRGPMLTDIGESAPEAAPESFKIAYNVQITGILLSFALALVFAASLIVRMRRATGDQRLQLEWFAYAAAIFVVALIAASPLFHGPELLQSLAFPLIPVASGVAILKYRLYDIDVVINKTVVFAALAAFVTAVYLAIVVGIGAVVGTTGNNLVLSIVATAIVAVAFQPLRERARRLANRVVYGRRATPYEVLADFAERVGDAYSADDILPRMARVLGEGTGATASEVWLHVGPEYRRAASWPADDPPKSGGAVGAGNGDLPEFPDADRAIAVRHQGEVLGALTIAKPPNEPLAPTEEKLLEDLASQAGLVLRNVRLTADLQARLEQLRTSRERLVAAQDEQRRKIERNLHDGAQQQLVALAVQARLAESFVGKDAEKERAMLAELQGGLTEALDTLRDLARGIYPPLLADRGLVAALEAQARKSVMSVEVTAEAIGRYPQEVEAAVYFCCLEGLQNVAKYARAAHVTVRLWSENGDLRFSVADDGRGFDVANTPLGAGLTNMSDRLAALGGELDVDSEPGRGSIVMGRLPARSTVAQHVDV